QAKAKGTTRASIGEGSTVVAGSVEVSANSAAEADATTVVTTVTVVGGAGDDSEATVDHRTQAFIGPQAGAPSSGAQTMIAAPGGAVTVNAASANKADAEADGGTFGLLDVGVLVVKAETHGSTDAYLGGSVRLNAAEADVTAHGDDAADGTGFLL